MSFPRQLILHARSSHTGLSTRAEADAFLESKRHAIQVQMMEEWILRKMCITAHVVAEPGKMRVTVQTVQSAMAIMWRIRMKANATLETKDFGRTWEVVISNDAALQLLRNP